MRILHAHHRSHHRLQGILDAGAAPGWRGQRLGNPEAYEYRESIRARPDQAVLAHQDSRGRVVGVRWRNLTGGQRLPALPDTNPAK